MTTHLLRLGQRTAPILLAAAVLLSWDVAAATQAGGLLPRPAAVAGAIGSLARDGLLWRHLAASLYRVTWGFLIASCVGIPAGVVLGISPVSRRAVNPWIQILRPISPLAWMPLAILIFGVSDAAPVFLIFLSSVFPIAVATTAAVQSIPTVYLHVGAGFRMRGASLIWNVVIPAALPQIMTALRVSLGVAWLVVVAAEMIAVDSTGLGYLVLDARNSGNRYDLVGASMILIGLTGLVLDAAFRAFERFDEVCWARSTTH